MNAVEDSVNALAAWLAATPVEATLVRAARQMPTVDLAAEALGVPASAIVKSIVFEHKNDPSIVCLAVAAGNARVSRTKVAAALQLRQLRLSPPDRVERATGYPAGGVPPVGHRMALPVVIDRRVFAQEVVFGGGGDEWHMLRITPQEIQRITGAVVADVIDDERTDVLQAGGPASGGAAR